jgi:lipoate-protein ligase A
MQILKKSIGVLYSDISSKDIREIFFTEMKKTMKPFLIKSSLAKREILNLIQLLNKDIENPYILYA